MRFRSANPGTYWIYSPYLAMERFPKSCPYDFILFKIIDKTSDWIEVKWLHCSPDLQYRLSHDIVMSYIFKSIRDAFKTGQTKWYKQNWSYPTYQFIKESQQVSKATMLDILMNQ